MCCVRLPGLCQAALPIQKLRQHPKINSQIPVIPHLRAPPAARTSLKMSGFGGLGSIIHVVVGRTFPCRGPHPPQIYKCADGRLSRLSMLNKSRGAQMMRQRRKHSSIELACKKKRRELALSGMRVGRIIGMGGGSARRRQSNASRRPQSAQQSKITQANAPNRQ